MHKNKDAAVPNVRPKIALGQKPIKKKKARASGFISRLKSNPERERPTKVLRISKSCVKNKTLVAAKNILKDPNGLTTHLAKPCICKGRLLIYKWSPVSQGVAF